MMLTSDLVDKARAMLSKPTTFGTVAAGLCMQLTDDEDCIHWDPAVLAGELDRILGKDHVNADVMQRVHAVSALLLDERFFTEPTVFHAVCATLLDPDNDPRLSRTPPEILELAWSCAEAQILLGDDYSSERYSGQVSRYCGVCLKAQGLIFPPATLKFADFPVDSYPDPEKYADELILTSWLDSQERMVEEINETLTALAKMMKDQLLELKPFGQDPSAFEALEASVERPRESSR